MGYRSGQFNVAHPFPAYLKVGYLHAAAVADNSLVTDRLELAAVTFPLFCSAEYALAEKTVLFRPKGAVINRFRLFHFSV